MDHGIKIEAAFFEAVELAWHEAHLNLMRHGQLLVLALLPQQLLVHGSVVKHDGHLQADGRQELQVFLAKRGALAETVELKDRESLAVLSNQGHAQERM